MNQCERAMSTIDQARVTQSSAKYTSMCSIPHLNPFVASNFETYFNSLLGV